MLAALLVNLGQARLALMRDEVAPWFERWRHVAPVLEEMRAQDIRQADTVRAMQLLDEAFESAVRLNPPRPTSGLVEQQAIFSRSRR